MSYLCHHNKKQNTMQKELDVRDYDFRCPELTQEEYKLMLSGKMKYKRTVHEVPRLLCADAYTIGSDQFQSDKAKEKSVYYVTFRRDLYKIDSELYTKGDNRMIFIGLQRKLDRILFKKVKQWEIDAASEFLANFKVTTNGLKPYLFPKHLWQRIVDEFDGRIPIRISAMPEGSVVYPNEPVIMIESLVDGFGELAAWFESKILQVWSDSERVTQDRHFYDKVREIYKKNFPHLTQAEVNFFASILLTDFGDRAGMNATESEDQGMAGLYTFPGTDTVCGAYQAWMNSDKTIGLSSSVYALAHRNVQAYDNENGAYKSSYEVAENGDYISQVNDCYGSRNSVKKYHVPLALRSKAENNGKILVSRPDSGVALDEILYIIHQAIENGLFEKVTFAGSTKEWICGTYLHFIAGDGLTHSTLLALLQTIIDLGFVPWTWGLFGMGGGKRNGLKRDNISAKYALCAMGNEYTGVVKFSDTFGKTTLPGPFKVLRSAEALANNKTIVFAHEPGENAMVVYYDGLAEIDFFDGGMLDSFVTIKERSHEQFDTMPKSLGTIENHNYPASDEVIAERKRLLTKYAPDKDTANY